MTTTTETTCTVGVCDRPRRTMSMCTSHYGKYARARKAENNLTSIDPAQCQGTNCKGTNYRAMMCEPHYKWWRNMEQPNDVPTCLDMYDRLQRSASPTKAMLGEPRAFPAPKGEIHVAFPVSITKGRQLDRYVTQGLVDMAMAWFDTPPAKVGFQLTSTARGPLLLARATERVSTHAHA